ncbi:FadR/GntR family transcriptional regulator [Viridibacterium curvum]|uniref:FCD domain-containing protein n=1 Tax=Viridibacterium curvum TaxID=1101404 RepID=A0ABP9QPU5_9RHOO
MPKLSSFAARALQRQIQDGQFARGSMLPGQRALAASLGISRSALREAVSTLEALGLLHIQPGKGVFVADGAVRATADLPASPMFDDPQVVFQFRAIVEPGAAALAAQRADAQGLKRLADIQHAMEEALHQQDLLAASEADLAFHLAIAEIAGNAMLASVIHSLEAPIAHSLRLPFADPDSEWMPALEHRVVLDAVVAHDTAAAHRAMRRHIASAAARVGLSLDLPVLESSMPLPLTPSTTGVTP